MIIERIVAATDFSQASELALQRAALLAATHGATLHVATVLPAGWLGQVRAWFAGADVQADVDAVGARLRAAAGALAAARTGTGPIETQVVEGDPRDEIAACAQRVGAQLVVVGAHGRSLVGEAVLGSTALALLERCDVPILVVRNRVDGDYRQVLAGVAFDAAAQEAVRAAAALCPQADLTLVHAYEDPFASELFLGQAAPEVEAHYRVRAREAAQRALDEFVTRLGALAARCHRLLVYGPPGLHLTRTAQARQAELVALGSRRKGLLETALLGSVAANVALLVTADVLLVREGSVPAS